MPRGMTVGLVLSLLAVAGSGCGGTRADAPPTAAELEACLQGWWLYAATACSCSKGPECSASDCQMRGVYRFGAEKGIFSGMIVYSGQTRTVSTRADGESGTYQVVDAAQIHVAIQAPAPRPAYDASAKCSGDKAVISYANWARAPADLAAGLDKASSNGTVLGWSAQPY